MSIATSFPADFRGVIEECAVRAMDEDIEGVPEWERFRVISDDLGKLLYILTRGTRRRKICELSGRGGAGSSLVWLAGAAGETGGEVITWEANPRRLVKLQNLLSRARLAPSVNVYTNDPLWVADPDGAVIAPPVSDNANLILNPESDVDKCDMIVLSLTEDDWPNRLAHGWKMLGTGGMFVLTDTIQAGESADVIIGEFFDGSYAAVVGLLYAEGIVIALKLGDESDRENGPVSDSELVGEQAGEVLEDLAERNRQPGSRLWAIPPITGRFLWMIVSMMQPDRILEIGASSGYSGTWLASALMTGDGRLVTMDLDPEKITLARDTYERAGVSDRVTLLEGDATEIIDSLEERYNVIFLDAEKSQYEELLEPALWHLNRGGLLIADNAISHAEELGHYIEQVQNHSCLVSVTLPIGSGEEVTMVL